MIEQVSQTHLIKLVDRKNISISGVKKIVNFDDSSFDLETVMGNISIKGEKLEVIKLDTIDGNVSIKGNINSIIYNDISTKESSFMAKLFR